MILLLLSLILFGGIYQVNKAYATPIVMAGSDYFQTLPGTYFDFGGPIGVVEFEGLPIGPGNTDTIVQRQEDADLTDGSDTVSRSKTLKKVAFLNSRL